MPNHSAYNNSASSLLESLSHQELRDSVSSIFKTADNTRGDVLLLEVEGKNAVLKDYSNSGKGFRLFVAPFLVYREIKTLRVLQNVDGIPGVVRKVSNVAFLMEYLPAERIRFVREQLNWQEFISKTEYLVEKLHEQGVVHGDLRNATNILVDSQQNPVFVDFVSAVHRGHPLNLFSFVLFKLCLRIDQGAMYKLKNKYAPELIDEVERELNSKQGLLEYVARWLSVRIRNFIQRVLP